MTPLFPIIEGDGASVKYLVAHFSEYTLRFLRATPRLKPSQRDSLYAQNPCHLDYQI